MRNREKENPSQLKWIWAVIERRRKRKRKKKKADVVWVVCYKPTAMWPPIKKKMKSFSWQFFETYGVISYGNGWRKDVVNQCLEFGTRQHSPYRHGTDGLVCRLLLLCGHIPSCIWYVECYCCVDMWFAHLVCRVLLLCGHIHSAYTFCTLYVECYWCVGMYLLHPYDLSRCLVYCVRIIGYIASGLFLAYKLGYLQCINHQTIQAQMSKVSTLPMWRGVTGFIQF